MGDILKAKLGFCFGQWFLLYQKQKKAFIDVSIKDFEIQNVTLLRGIGIHWKLSVENDFSDILKFTVILKTFVFICSTLELLLKRFTTI